jgi:hypothetical protein
MPEILHSSDVKMFADDAKLYKSRKRDENMAVGLQRDLTSFELWCNEWQLYINGRKCKCLRIGWSATDQSNYTIAGELLSNEQVMKDLGIWIDNKMTFSSHCSKISSQAAQRVGLIYRAFSSRSVTFMRSMFVAYVRPILEYGSEIWSPLYLRDIDMIERIQRKFLKRIDGCSGLSYGQRLIVCELESLELRRLKRDVTLVYKIANGLVDLDFADFFQYAPERGTRGNNRKLYASFARKSVVMNFFCNRVVNYWNSLPNEVVDAASLSIFKNKLDQNVAVLTQFMRGRAFRDQ